MAADDADAFQRASREFHEALLSPCRMPRLLHMLDIAWNLTEPVQTMMRTTEEDRAGMREDHQLMLDAFVARDAEAAQGRGRCPPRPADRLHRPDRRLTARAAAGPGLQIVLDIPRYTVQSLMQQRFRS